MWGHAHLRTCRFPAAIAVSCQNLAHSTYHRLKSKHLPSDSNSVLSSEIALGRLCPKSAATTANSYNLTTCYNTAAEQTEHYISQTAAILVSVITSYSKCNDQWKSKEYKRLTNHHLRIQTNRLIITKGCMCKCTYWQVVSSWPNAMLLTEP